MQSRLQFYMVLYFTNGICHCHTVYQEKCNYKKTTIKICEMYLFASHNDVYEKNESKTICQTHLKFLEQHMKDFFLLFKCIFREKSGSMQFFCTFYILLIQKIGFLAFECSKDKYNSFWHLLDRNLLITSRFETWIIKRSYRMC